MLQSTPIPFVGKASVKCRTPVRMSNRRVFRDVKHIDDGIKRYLPRSSDRQQHGPVASRSQSHRTPIFASSNQSVIISELRSSIGFGGTVPLGTRCKLGMSVCLTVAWRMSSPFSEFKWIRTSLNPGLRVPTRAIGISASDVSTASST